MRKAGRLRGAAVASVARLYSSVRCMSPDRACRGAPEGTRFACVPKQPGPRKAAMGIGLITVCDAAFRAAPLAPVCPRAVPHTRVGTKAGGCHGAVAWRFSRIPTAPSRLSATALASPEHGDPVKRGACSRLARMYHQPPLRRICTALVGTEGSNPVCSSAESTNYRFLGGGGASAVCSAVPNVRIHLPSSGESANYHSFCHGRWMVNPSEPDPVARGLYSVRGRRGAAT
jgi:hypothetical protein